MARAHASANDRPARGQDARTAMPSAAAIPEIQGHALPRAPNLFLSRGTLHQSAPEPSRVQWKRGDQPTRALASAPRRERLPINRSDQARRPRKGAKPECEHSWRETGAKAFLSSKGLRARSKAVRLFPRKSWLKCRKRDTFPRNHKSRTRKKRGNKVRRQAGRQAGRAGQEGAGRGRGRGGQAPRQAGRHHPFSHLFAANRATRPSDDNSPLKSPHGRQVAPRNGGARAACMHSELRATCTALRATCTQVAPRTTSRPSSRPSDDKSPLGRQVAPRNGGARAACMAT